MIKLFHNYRSIGYLPIIGVFRYNYNRNVILSTNVRDVKGWYKWHRIRKEEFLRAHNSWDITALNLLIRMEKHIDYDEFEEAVEKIPPIHQLHYKSIKEKLTRGGKIFPSVWIIGDAKPWILDFSIYGRIRTHGLFEKLKGKPDYIITPKITDVPYIGTFDIERYVEDDHPIKINLRGPRKRPSGVRYHVPSCVRYVFLDTRTPVEKGSCDFDPEYKLEKVFSLCDYTSIRSPKWFETTHMRENVFLTSNHNNTYSSGALINDFFDSLFTDLNELIKEYDKSLREGLSKTEYSKKVKKRPYNVYIFAHNFSGFDGKLIFDYLIDYVRNNFNKVPTVHAYSNLFYSVNINFARNGRLILICRRHLLQSSLSDLSKAFLNRNKDDIDVIIYKDHIADIIENDEMMLKYSEYCLKDRKLLAKIILKHINVVNETLNEVTNLKRLSLGHYITRAHLSNTIFIHSFYNSFDYPLLHIPKRSEDEKNIRKSYFGGRCEVFNIFDKNVMDEKSHIIHYDVPGIYQQAIMEPLPYGDFIKFFNYKVNLNRTKGQNKILDILKSIHESKIIAFIKCSLSINPQIGEENKFVRIIPSIPVKYKGKLTFPLGSFNGTYTRLELLNFIVEGGSIESIEYIYVYKTAPFLADYVDTWGKIKRQAKENGNEPMRLFAKIIVNRLYGRFGSDFSSRTYDIWSLAQWDRIKETPFITNSAYHLPNNYVLIKYDKGDVVNQSSLASFPRWIISKIKQDSTLAHINNSRVPVASRIASISRIVYFHILKTLWNHYKGDIKIIYGDTDSVYARIEKDKPLPFGSLRFNIPFLNGYKNILWDNDQSEIYRAGFFLLPKITFVINEDGQVSKIKGYKQSGEGLDYNVCIDIIHGKRREFSQVKLKRYGMSAIYESDTVYRVCLKQEFLKRKFIKDEHTQQYNGESTPFILHIHSQDSDINWVKLTNRASRTSDIQIYSERYCNKLSPLKTNPEFYINYQDGGKTFTLLDLEITTSWEVYTYKDHSGHTLRYGACVDIIKSGYKGFISLYYFLLTIFEITKADDIFATYVLITSTRELRTYALTDGRILSPKYIYRKEQLVGINVFEFCTNLINRWNEFKEKYEVEEDWQPFSYGMAVFEFDKVDTIDNISVINFEICKTNLAMYVEKTARIVEQIQERRRDIDDVRIFVNSFYTDKAGEQFEVNTPVIPPKGEIALLCQEHKVLDIKYKSSVFSEKTLEESSILTLINIADVAFTPQRFLYSILYTLDVKPTTRYLTQIYDVGSYLCKFLRHRVEIGLFDKKRIRSIENNKIVTTNLFYLSRKNKLQDLKELLIHKRHGTAISLTPFEGLHKSVTPHRSSFIHTLQNTPVYLNISWAKILLKHLYEFIKHSNKYKYNDPEFIKIHSWLLGTINPKYSKVKGAVVEAQYKIKSLKYLIELTNNGEHEFYFKYKIDSRGRVYPLSRVSHLGTRWERLLFTPTSPKRAKVLKDNKEYLIYIQYQLDELDIEMKNSPIEEYLKNYIHELETGLDNIVDVIPISLDATNRAYQHLSALTGRVKIGHIVGVYSRRKNIDLYQKIGIDIYEIIIKDKLGDKFKECLNVKTKKELNKVMRKIAKKPTIIYIYNATQYTIQNRIREVIISQGSPLLISVQDRREILSPIVSKLYELYIELITYGDFVRISELKILVGMRVKRLTKSGTIFIFKLPDGFKIISSYYKREIHTARGQDIEFNYKLSTNVINSRKIIDAAMANYIHRLDAYHLVLIFDRFKNKDIEALPIHDCVLVSPFKWEITQDVIISTFKAIYTHRKIIIPQGVEIDNSNIKDILTDEKLPNPSKDLWKW